MKDDKKVTYIVKDSIMSEKQCEDVKSKLESNGFVVCIAEGDEVRNKLQERNVSNDMYEAGIVFPEMDERETFQASSK